MSKVKQSHHIEDWGRRDGPVQHHGEGEGQELTKCVKEDVHAERGGFWVKHAQEKAHKDNPAGDIQ
jgi:hypothetical protein